MKKLYVVDDDTGRGTLAIYPQGVIDVLDERLRQHDAEGWTPEHDDTHDQGEMAQASACYIMRSLNWSRDAVWEIWPKSWRFTWLKDDGGRRRYLVKAAALLLAEIERIDRAEARKEIEK